MQSYAAPYLSDSRTPVQHQPITSMNISSELYKYNSPTISQKNIKTGQFTQFQCAPPGGSFMVARRFIPEPRKTLQKCCIAWRSTLSRQAVSDRFLRIYEI